jgi:hypothetical protein
MIVLGPKMFYELAKSRRYQMVYEHRDLKSAGDDSPRQLLFELRQMELNTACWTIDRPSEFFDFDRRQRIRKAGFDPVWRDGDYILRDISSGNEFDPFLSKQGIEFRFSERFDRGEFWMESLIYFDAYKYESKSCLPAEMHYYLLNGFHLVLKDDKSYYTRNIMDDDQELTLEAAFLMHYTMMYNVTANSEIATNIERSEAYLRGRGFIMTRRGDDYFPVSLETGAGPELPPKSVYVAAALDELNRGEAVTKYVAKTTLDMYDVGIAWNESEKRYELVR